MEIESAQEDSNELEQKNLAASEKNPTLPESNTVPEAEGHCSRNTMEFTSELKLCCDDQVLVSEETLEGDSLVKHENMVQTVPAELQCAENDKNATTAESQSPSISLQAEGQMDVAAQLGSLHFRSEMTDRNVKVENQSLDSDCPDVRTTGEHEVAVDIDRVSYEDSSSDSDTDSDSSSSSSSAFSAIVKVDDVDELNGTNEAPLKTKDEILLDELPAVDECSIILPEDVELKPFGIVSSIIELLVIIESLKDIPPISEDSVIFNSHRHSVGKIFEIFGPVPHPFYVLRFNNKDQIQEKDIQVNHTMYFVPTVQDFTQYIIPDKLKSDKGSDASWTNDQEPPQEALDFSDDEKEREAKQMKKSQNSGKRKPNQTSNRFPDQNRGPNFSGSRARPGQGFSRNNVSLPRENTYGQQHGPFYQRDFSRQHLMQQPYTFHNSGSQEYPLPLSNDHFVPPNAYGSHFGHQHNFYAPPSNMAWSDPNVHAHYMQNIAFYSHPPPPPPPPPPPGNSGSSQFGSPF